MAGGRETEVLERRPTTRGSLAGLARLVAVVTGDVTSGGDGDYNLTTLLNYSLICYD